ncbi:endonuclease/exonuclease/phosphatase family protein [Paraburkholderia acidiphila]|uniref:Endonuclease/exonuclease/phosphatase domain-containing protein n=1 Tax=Paraburkholderia acidiphila TaxID=2571747 RepID=A0A7Z2JCJ9_9BURK|nr:endonuclease/exonuclease/phosphatase family protein [Paraburkholderia acidiphila]QGZ58524.1 hypothetical protein FAZ97_26425 [Paraburkholderia acidiphila]
MRTTVATWNSQGYNNAKWDIVKQLARSCSVICLQEAGALASEPAGTQRDGLYIYGWSGADTDAYRNNRVSLAIVSTQQATSIGFSFGYDRGLGYITIGNMLYGTWHEKRGNGGIAQALIGALRETGATTCIIGGDFNDQTFTVHALGSSSRSRMTIRSVDSSAYNFAYSGTPTHKVSGHNLDRVYVSNNLTIIHHWAISVPVSDHNPVCATVVDSTADMTYWESFKSLFA